MGYAKNLSWYSKVDKLILIGFNGKSVSPSLYLGDLGALSEAP